LPKSRGDLFGFNVQMLFNNNYIDFVYILTILTIKLKKKNIIKGFDNYYEMNYTPSAKPLHLF